MVPVVAQLAEEMGDQPAPGVKEEDPQHRRDGGATAYGSSISV